MSQENKRQHPCDDTLVPVEETAAQKKRRTVTTHPGVLAGPDLPKKEDVRSLLEECGMTGEGISSDDDEFPVDHAMFLLRLNPSLIMDAFEDYPAISFFLKSGASTPAMMEELCAMWKAQEKVETESFLERGFLGPVNLVVEACLFCRDPELFRVVLREFPQHANQPVVRENWAPIRRWDNPVDMFLDERSQAGDWACDILEILFEACPQFRDSVHEFFEWAICGRGFSRAISNFLLRKIRDDPSPHAKNLEYICHYTEGWDHESVNEASLILPNLQCLKIQEMDPNIPAISTATLNMLYEARPLQLLTALEIPVIYELPDHQYNQLVLSAIQACPNLKDIGLDWQEAQHSTNTNPDGQAYCQLCRDVLLQQTHALESFVLHAVPSSTEASTLSSLFRAAMTKTKSFQIEPQAGYTDDWVHVFFDVPPNCVLRRLEIDYRFGLSGILTQLLELESLRELEIFAIEWRGPHDINQQIGDLLALNRLESLALYQRPEAKHNDDYSMSLGLLTRSLQHDTTLKTLELDGVVGADDAKQCEGFLSLLEGNVTLQDAYLGGSVQALLSYYTCLNECGRAKLVVPGVLMQDLVNALDRAGQKLTFKRFSGYQVRYGLLRCNPGSWSAAALAGMSARCM